jgi:type IV pilus assembly protein PilQ
MTTRQTSRCTYVPSAFGRTAAPALILAILAGTASGQSERRSDAGSPPSPRSATAEAASSMMSDRAQQEQAGKKKVGTESGVAGDVKVSPDQIVDLHIKDEDLTRVLELLAIQSQRNIIPTKSVNARVSANLYGVTFYEALDALLHPNGFGWMERSNRIEVYTLEELKQIEAANRSRIAKVIRLNYLNAVDAGAFVEALLSDGGQIKTNGKTPSFSIPEKVPIGQDDYANDSMLVVYDYEENVNEIERLIKEIDTRPSQVLVEATILQTQLNEANAFGVDFSVLGDLNFTEFSGNGGPLSAVNGLIAGKSKDVGGSEAAMPSDGEGRALVSSPGNTSGPGTIKLGLVDSDVAIFLRALDEVGDTTIISNPKVLALNRQPARVLVGRKVGYLNTTSTETASTQTVEFLDTGTQLYFRPFVTNEGLIRLELKPAVSEAVIRDAKDASGASVTIPDEITNEIVTNVIVRDGQTVVLGGLFRESTQSSRRQVPLLGDIPLLGAAFRGHEDETARNEIIFMIRPSIVSDQVLVMQGERAGEIVDAARIGSRESLLPWSREKRSGQLLVEAEALAAEGKDDEALLKIQQSLRMNHTQPEAIALRERISTKKAKWPGRSMLDEIITRETAPAKPTATGPVPTTVVGGSTVLQTTTDTNATQTFGTDGHTNNQTNSHTTGTTTTDQVTSTTDTATAPGFEVNASLNATTGAGTTTTTTDGTAVTTGSTTGTTNGTTKVQIIGESTGATTTSSIEYTTDGTTTSTVTGHNVEGSVSNTSGSVSATTETQAASQQVQYVTAWAWFFGGFREFFVSPTTGEFTTRQAQGVEGQQQNQQHDQAEANVSTVTSADADQ